MDAKWHVQGNNEAGMLAVAAAELHAVPSEQAKIFIKVYSDLKDIQNRLIHVTKLFPHREHITKLSLIASSTNQHIKTLL